MNYSRKMLRSYLETALWSSADEGDEGLDANYSIDDVSFATKRQAVRDLHTFCRMAGELLDGLSPVVVAHDFWLTRNGHGAGFWDVDYPEEVGKALTELAHSFGSVDLYVGDDGLIHS